MKSVFAGIFAVLVAWSFVARAIRPSIDDGGKIPLIWVSDDNPARREQAELFDRLNPQYDVRVDPDNANTDKIILQALGGVGPDLLNCHGGAQLSTFVRSGIVQDVTDDLKAMGIDETAFYRCTDPLIKYDGRLYGVPLNAGANALWYNKDIFDAEGIPYPKGPWKWEEFIPLAQKMTKRDANGRVLRFGVMYPWMSSNEFIEQWGGSVYSPDGTRCVIDSPQAIAAVQFLHDLMYKYHVMPTPVDEATLATTGGFGTGLMTMFMAGKAPMAVGGRWWLCVMRGNRMRLGATEAPHGPRRVFLGYGKGVLINAKSPRAKDALQFLAYAASKPYNDLINHQADALAPVRAYNETEEFLHDPDFPDEDYNAMWRDVMEHAIPDRISPYIEAGLASQIIGDQIDLVKGNQKSPAEALGKAAKLVNEAIAKSIARDASLQARYQAALAAQKAVP